MLCLVRHGLTVTIDHEGDVPVYIQLASILRVRSIAENCRRAAQCRASGC